MPIAHLLCAAGHGAVGWSASLSICFAERDFCCPCEEKALSKEQQQPLEYGKSQKEVSRSQLPWCWLLLAEVGAELGSQDHKINSVPTQEEWI